MLKPLSSTQPSGRGTTARRPQSRYSVIFKRKMAGVEQVQFSVLPSMQNHRPWMAGNREINATFPPQVDPSAGFRETTT
jgi:hypothetical protein